MDRGPMHVSKPFKWLQSELARFVADNGTDIVCEFVGASRKTVKRWATKQTPAKGAYEIRLWHFLLAAGYTFPELRIPEYNFYLAQLFAYQVITIEEVCEFAGVKNEQTALQIMRGQPPMHPSFTLDELVLEYGQALQNSVDAFTEKLGVVDGSGTGFVPDLPDLPEAPDDVEALAPAFDELVPVLANMLRATSPLAEIALERMTPAQRSTLRELVGVEAMFDLSNQLNALCSERARSNQGRK